MCLLMFPFVLLSVACSSVNQVTAVSAPVPECALRFEDNGVCACSTHDPEGPVKCHNDSRYVEIQPCHCVYYDEHLNKTVVGACFFTCYQHYNTFIEVTSSTEFNDNFCYDGYTHRSGFFCYRCNNTYAMAPYSELLINCVRCEHYGFTSWLKYFMISLLPLTLLYILAVLLSCNITSSSLSGIVLVIQCIESSPLRSELYFFRGTFRKLVHGLLEMVNLDFFRSICAPFCLHPKLNSFQVWSLSYIIAIYPFFLIFLTYALISAYDSSTDCSYACRNHSRSAFIVIARLGIYTPPSSRYSLPSFFCLL